MEEGFNFSGMDSIGGEGGFSGSSGVSGDDEQSFSSGVSGFTFGDFMSNNNSGVSSSVPSWLVLVLVLGVFYFLMKGRI